MPVTMLDEEDRRKFDRMSTKELLEAFVANIKVVATVCENVLGDQPMPDPREMVKAMEDVTPTVWVNMFLDETTRDSLRAQMPLMKAMAEVNNENMYIITRMMKIQA